MRIICDRHVSYGAGLPTDEVAEANADSYSAFAASLERAKAGAAIALSLQQAHHERMRALVGAEGLARLQRLRADDLRQRGLVVEVNTADARQRRAERLRQGEKLLAELGIKAQALESLQKEWRDAVAKSLPQALPTLGDGPEPIVRTIEAEADLPDHIREILRQPVLKKPKPQPSPDSWTCFRYPYIYNDSYYNERYATGWVSEGSTATYHDALDPYLMLVGQMLEIRGDDFGSQLEAGNCLGFRYKVPRMGRLEIEVHVAKVDTNEWADHVVSFVDTSWLSSYAQAVQQNYISARVDGVQSSPHLVAHTHSYKVFGDEEGRWMNSLPSGDARVVLFQTETVFDEGKEVKIFVGSHSRNYADSFNMNVVSRMHFQWGIIATCVRTVPFF
jgi:hypothetical protein